MTLCSRGRWVFGATSVPDLVTMSFIGGLPMPRLRRREGPVRPDRMTSYLSRYASRESSTPLTPCWRSCRDVSRSSRPPFDERFGLMIDAELVDIGDPLHASANLIDDRFHAHSKRPVLSQCHGLQNDGTR